MNHFRAFLVCVMFCFVAKAQNIPSNRVLSNQELPNYLNSSIKNNVQLIEKFQKRN